MVSVELVKLFNEIFSVFSENTGMVKNGFTSGDRYNFTESLGRAGSTYRQSVYTDSFRGEKELLSVSKLLEFLNLSLLYIDDTIKANRRDNMVLPDILIHFRILLENSNKGRARGMVAVEIISSVFIELTGKTPILPIIKPTP